MTENDKPVVSFRVLQSVEDYVDDSGKFRTKCAFFKIPGSDSNGANTIYIPYCEKQRFDFGPTLNDYRANGVFTPPTMGTSWSIPDFVVFGEYFHDIHCPQSCKGYRNKRVVALLDKFRLRAKAVKQAPIPPAEKQKESITPGVTLLVTAGVALLCVILGWMTPEGRRLLRLDKPQEQQTPIQSVSMPHNDSTPQSKAVPAEKHGTVEVLPPTTANVDVTVKSAPSQTVTATVGHPKKKLRTKIGDLITEGTKIRDIAPVYVGTPEPDVMAEWMAWSGKVEQFLTANFDSAEVAKFRSFDDPNTSLNSKIYFEIAYLEQLLEKVGQEPQASTTNNASGGIINNGGVITNPTINNAASPQKAHPYELSEGKRSSFVKLLSAQEVPRDTLRIGCTSWSESSCVAAGRFALLFSEAGWQIEDNKVFRLEPQIPIVGVAIATRAPADEPKDPLPPHMGRWRAMDESHKTIYGAFRLLDIPVGGATDNTLKDGTLGIYFGPEPQ
jgi:hypothetical protein